MYGIDLRRRERYEYNKNILCFQCSNTGDHKVKIPFIIKIKDISYGGMKIACSQLLPKDSLISFRFTENDISRVFNIKIIWSKFNGEFFVMGTEFIDVVKEDIIFLFRMIRPLEIKNINNP